MLANISEINLFGDCPSLTRVNQGAGESPFLGPKEHALRLLEFFDNCFGVRFIHTVFKLNHHRVVYPTKVILQGLEMGFIKNGKFAICYYYSI
jgi:hypothetical protein